MGSTDRAAVEPAVAALGRLSCEVSDVVDEILATYQPTVVAVDDLRLLFSTAVRLYAGISSVVLAARRTRANA